MIEQFLLGTYTRGESEGIYTVDLNKETDELSNLQLKAKTDSPTYLDNSFDLTQVYSIGGENDKKGIVSFKVDKDGNFDQTDSVLGDGAAPCYVRLDEKRNLVYTANYHDGEIATYKTDGQLSLTLLDKVTHSGSSVHKNQDAPHAHYFDLSPNEKFLLACDLGTDEIITYSVDDDGKIEHVTTFDTPEGFGPRHIVFHPNAEFLYAFGELSNEILALEFNQSTGEIAFMQKISTLPEDFDGESSGAAIRISNDGDFLYASNRGHNSIVAFHVEADGELSVLNWYDTHGNGPRDFNFSTQQDYLLIGHQFTDALTLYKRDTVSGELELLQTEFYAPEVVSVKNFDSSI